MAAIFTVTVWGVTYIFTKKLLTHFTPYQLLFMRFSLAWLVLLTVDLRNLRRPQLQSELVCIILALTGVFFYFIFETFALTMTYSANVGLIMSAVPLFTALISHFVFKTERFTPDTAVGFAIAMSGIGAVLLNGTILKLNIIGDLLALIAAISFALYSAILRRYPLAKKMGQHVVVRKTFFYSALMLVPVVIVSGGIRSAKTSLQWLISDYQGYVSLIFLSLIASSLCFYLWNLVVDRLGALRATGFIYLVPLVSTAAAVFVLKESVTPLMISGGILIVLGVVINERKPIHRRLSVAKEVL